MNLFARSIRRPAFTLAALAQTFFCGLVPGLLGLVGCSTHTNHTVTSSMEGDLTILQGTNRIVWNQTSLSRRLSAVVIEVNDPVYVKRKRYLGYWLTDVFKLSGIASDRSDVWVFSALDGYQARITAAEAMAVEAKPFLAIRDMDASEGWEPIQQGKQWLSPGPYYLVWQPRTGITRLPKLPWPYQLVEIHIRNMDEVQEKLFPKDADHTESVTRGFEVFQKNCIACHSLNLEGGALGPELNIPKNIFEYRDRKTLKEFISNPGSFRARSKMPAFGDSLSSQAFDDLLDYLEWMGKHKYPQS